MSNNQLSALTEKVSRDDRKGRLTVLFVPCGASQKRQSSLGSDVSKDSDREHNAKQPSSAEESVSRLPNTYSAIFRVIRGRRSNAFHGKFAEGKGRSPHPLRL